MCGYDLGEGHPHMASSAAIKVGTAATVVTGMGLAVLGAWLDGLAPRDICMIGLTLACMGVIVACNMLIKGQPSAAAYELGRLEGYQEGWHDGRGTNAPQVVQLRGCATCAKAARQDVVS